MGDFRCDVIKSLRTTSKNWYLAAAWSGLSHHQGATALAIRLLMLTFASQASFHSI